VDKLFYFGGKMPVWMEWLFRREGIPDPFRVEDLTEDQVHLIKFVVALDELVKDGLVEIEFTDEDEGPRAKLTPKGVKWGLEFILSIMSR